MRGDYWTVLCCCINLKIKKFKSSTFLSCCKQQINTLSSVNLTFTCNNQTRKCPLHATIFKMSPFFISVEIWSKQ